MFLGMFLVAMDQWEFQDPKMEVLYHIRADFLGNSRDIPLHRPYIGLIYGRYLQFRFLKWPLNGYKLPIQAAPRHCQLV